jgi:dienelactone hydrolase
MSPRNRMVAANLNHEGLATLLLDLLTAEEAAAEEATGALRFNIPFLTTRLIAATRWALSQDDLRTLPIGFFGASTGAAAALCAAAALPAVQAVVSRGGRTDLAGDAVSRVAAPTLLIAGEHDQPVIAWNHATLERLPGVKHLAVVHGATHLFHEPGALEQVAVLAAGWFKIHLSSPR